MADKTAIISIRMPEDLEIEEVLERIAEEPDDNQYDTDKGEVSWDLLEPEYMIKLDPRQREAASALLMAFDLPAEMMAVSQTMLLAALINPGSTIGSMGSTNRKDQLLRAKELIDQMLGEIDAP